MKTKVSFFLNNIIIQHLILVTKAWFLICDVTNKDILTLHDEVCFFVFYSSCPSNSQVLIS